MLNFIQIAKTPLLLGLRQKWMIPSCCLWKVVTFFGKEHVNWSSISGVMIRRSWKIKFGKLKIGVTKRIMDMIFQLLLIITQQIFYQFTCSLPKNVTTFHRQQDEIIHFCLSPNKRAVLAIWMKLHNHVWKSPLSFWQRYELKVPNHPFHWEWDKNVRFHLVACEK